MDIVNKGGPPPEAPPLRWRGPNRDAPLVDPPDNGASIPESTPGLATMAFPCIFAKGAAYFHSARRVALGFMDWARNILINEDGRAMGGKRCRYWAFNANGRMLAFGMWQVLLDRAPGDAAIKLPDIGKADTKSTVREMSAFTSEIPGTSGEAAQAR